MVPIKLNILAWKIALRRIPSKINLSKRGICCINDLCAVCGDNPEDEDHIFRQCTTASQLLRLICGWWNINLDQIPSLNGLLSWAESLGFNGAKRELFMAVIYTFFWCIWRARNESAHGKGSAIHASKIFDQIQNRSFFFGVKIGDLGRC